MARPRKGEDYIVQRIADLFRYADGLPSSQFPLQIVLAEKRVLLRNERDIHTAIGRLLCDVNPNMRPYVLNRLADALRQKPRQFPPDEIALVREACRIAKSKLKGLYKSDDPTWREFDAEYYKLTGYHLDRRAVEDAGCQLRPDTRPGRHGRQE